MKIWEEENQCYVRAAMEQNTPEENEALRKRFEEIDWSVFEHIERKETVNERGVFAPLEAVELDEIRARDAEFREIGLEEIRAGKVGAVLLAGGQGTRLGLDRPKGTLNIGIDRELYLFEQLIRNLTDVTDEAGAYVPLCHDEQYQPRRHEGIFRGAWLFRVSEGRGQILCAGDGTCVRL